MAAEQQYSSLPSASAIPSLSARLLHLARTASSTSFATASALIDHFVHGPPHNSWSWQTTAVRAILRSSVLFNPPSETHSLQMVRNITQFTYPTVPGKFVYHSSWWLYPSWSEQQYISRKSGVEADPRIETLRSMHMLSPETDRMHSVSGEWVCWNRLEEMLKQRIFKQECQMSYATVPSSSTLIPTTARATADPLLSDLKVVIYVHGGAFHLLSARTHRCITAKLSEATGSVVLALNQRLGPKHNFAAAIEDVMLTYLALIGERPPAHVYTATDQPLASLNISSAGPSLEQTVRDHCEEHRKRMRERRDDYEIWLKKHNKLNRQHHYHQQQQQQHVSEYLSSTNYERYACGSRMRDPDGPISVGDYLSNAIYRPDQIIFCGDSSGGNTAIAAVIALKEAGYPVPGAVVLFSPWLDPPSTTDSWHTSESTCYLPYDLPGIQENLIEFCRPYYPTHPLVAPYYATRDMLSGLPPVLIQVGDIEALRDESVEWGLCMNRVGGKCRVEVYDGAFHVFHAFSVWNKTREAAFNNVATWLTKWMAPATLPIDVASTTSTHSSEITDTPHEDVVVGTVALEEDEQQKANCESTEDIVVRVPYVA